MSTRSAFAPETFAANSSHLAFRNLRQHLQTRILGQEHLVDSLLIALLADGQVISAALLGLPEAAPASPAQRSLDEPSRAAIEAALASAHGVVSRAAQALGMSRQALYRRMERYALPPDKP